MNHFHSPERDFFDEDIDTLNLPRRFTLSYTELLNLLTPLQLHDSVVLKTRDGRRIHALKYILNKSPTMKHILEGDASCTEIPVNYCKEVVDIMVKHLRRGHVLVGWMPLDIFEEAMYMMNQYEIPELLHNILMCNRDDKSTYRGSDTRLISEQVVQLVESMQGNDGWGNSVETWKEGSRYRNLQEKLRQEKRQKKRKRNQASETTSKRKR